MFFFSLFLSVRARDSAMLNHLFFGAEKNDKVWNSLCALCEPFFVQLFRISFSPSVILLIRKVLLKFEESNELNWLQIFIVSSSLPFSLQDCHIKTHSSTGEPVPDTSQDYVLLSSSENATHTTLRFRRKLDTCDEKFDVPITVRVNNSLVNLIWNYTGKSLFEIVFRSNSSGTSKTKEMPLILYEY